MLRHSSHLFFGALWLVALLTELRQHAPLTHLVLGLVLVLAYLAGLAWQRLRPAQARQLLVGRVWVASLVACWMLLCALSTAWTWTAFPLFFLVLFICPPPASWLVVAAMALWAALSPLWRSQPLGVGGLLGPVLGAGVAVIGWLVMRQLVADLTEQRRLSDEVARMAAERARQAEREAIARDLHDTLAQGLNSIVLLSRTAAAQHPQAGDMLEGIEQVARENLAQARAMVRELAPGARPGLVAELGAVVAQVREREQLLGNPLELVWESSGTPFPLTDDQQRSLVMALRSLLANVVQHSGARRCRVELTWFDDEVHLDVVDDGQGFDPEQVTGDSYGLRALRSRLAETGGGVELGTAPGQGTSVGVVLARPASPTTIDTGGRR